MLRITLKIIIKLYDILTLLTNSLGILVVEIDVELMSEN